jgi:hypothetical protein
MSGKLIINKILFKSKFKKSFFTRFTFFNFLLFAEKIINNYKSE